MVSRWVILVGVLALCASCSSSGGKPKRTAGYESEEVGQSTSGRTLLQRLSSGERYRLEKLGFPSSTQLEEEFSRGQYLVYGPAACGSCHSATPFIPGGALSGGRKIEDEFSAVHAANITPDPETGIGNWNIAHIMRALRSSLGRHKEALSLDAHAGYAWMSDADMKAIAVFLLAQEPVSNKVPRRELSRWDRNSYLFFPRHSENPGYVPAIPATAKADYGKYLTTSVAQCATCHANIDRRNESEGEGGGKKSGSFWGVVFRLLTFQWIRYDNRPEWLNEEARDNQLFAKAGYDEVVKSGEFPIKGPDIRGNSNSGIRDWTQQDIVTYLSSGRTPTGEYSDGRVCRWPYYRLMKSEDKLAIAAYLKSLQ